MEVECTIHGPFKDTYAAVQSVSEGIQSAFKLATAKIGGIEIDYQIKAGYASCDKITLEAAEHKRKIFLQKFAG